MQQKSYQHMLLYLLLSHLLFIFINITCNCECLYQFYSFGYIPHSYLNLKELPELSLHLLTADVVTIYISVLI